MKGNAASHCAGGLNLKIENDRTLLFCNNEDGLKVNEKCKLDSKKCQLLKDWKLKESQILKMNPLSHSRTKNPGSWICDQLGWKVLMGQMYDQSQVCVCEHPSGDAMTCSSFLKNL